MTNPYQVVKDFERALCDYTGAPYAVTVNSCTNALFLALKYQRHLLDPEYCPKIEIPKRTYVSVPMQIKHAGFKVSFRDEDWKGYYLLRGTEGIYDCARWFTKNLFDKIRTLEHGDDANKQFYDSYVCVSFHWSKTLGVQQGGAILHNDPAFDEWARLARFDGRTEGVAPIKDDFKMLGYHMYMSPEIAAEGLVRIKFLKDHNDPLPNDNYPDLSQMEIFK